MGFFNFFDLILMPAEKGKAKVQVYLRRGWGVALALLATLWTHVGGERERETWSHLRERERHFA